MFYFITTILGLAVGGLCVFMLLQEKLKQVKAKQTELDTDTQQVRDRLAKIKSRESELNELSKELAKQRSDIESRVVSYRELQDENAILKRDIQNIDVNMRKLEMDTEVQQRRQKQIDERAVELGSRYLKENVKWISSSLTPNNFTACKQRLLDVIERCRGIGFSISDGEQAVLVADLKSLFEKAVRAAFEREEQARIKAQIREEERLKREVEREVKQLERERAAIQTALETALKEAKDEHSEEVERLKARLAEAEAKSQRALSQAQITKSGHVYVISNPGSFGRDVFKIGMTRRLEPNDRVKELGDASVPFPFDVHMMISCDDAPALENALHREFHRLRLNKVNLRKEFFKVNIEDIRKVVEQHHGQVEYIADAEALEYNQSMTMSEEDLEYIESVYDAVEDDGEPVPDGL